MQRICVCVCVGGGVGGCVVGVCVCVCVCVPFLVIFDLLNPNPNDASVYMFGILKFG